MNPERQEEILRKCSRKQMRESRVDKYQNLADHIRGDASPEDMAFEGVETP